MSQSSASPKLELIILLSSVKGNSSPSLSPGCWFVMRVMRTLTVMTVMTVMMVMMVMMVVMVMMMLVAAQVDFEAERKAMQVKMEAEVQELQTHLKWAPR